MRLDNYLVELGLAPSRSKAQSYIKDALVRVDGVIITKSSHKVTQANSVTLQLKEEYVSRAAWKLAYFLDEISLEIEGRSALDIGSSTGGFTQVLLKRGAKSVVCVDVGSDQLHPLLRQDLRVELYERCDIRSFVHEPFELVVCDVSFISLLHILKSIDRLAREDIILLFKPQFEVGVGVRRSKRGVVKDMQAIKRAMESFERACFALGWRQIAKAASKITGRDGNLEYCYYFKRG